MPKELELVNLGSVVLANKANTRALHLLAPRAYTYVWNHVDAVVSGIAEHWTLDRSGSTCVRGLISYIFKDVRI